MPISADRESQEAGQAIISRGNAVQCRMSSAIFRDSSSKQPGERQALRWLCYVGVILSLVVSCSDSSSKSNTPSTDPNFLEGEVPAGYTRYVTPNVEIPPGESLMWIHWVAAPMDRDVDVVDVKGYQSKGGHHALLYSTTDIQPVGYTRDWRATDQFQTRFVGGVGGEGVSQVKLPEGMVFRIPKGSGLIVNTHFVNPTPNTIWGNATIDVKMVDPGPGRIVANLFSSTTPSIDIKPNGDTTLDLKCTLKEELKLVMYSNHMHEWGLATETFADLPDGTRLSIKKDPEWSDEWAFDPNFTVHTADAPLKLPMGTTLTTRCTWRNSSPSSVGFPDEMCVFFGFNIAESDITCVVGEWMK